VDGTKIGTFAETAIVDHGLKFADQGKQTSFFRFRFLFVNCSKQTEVVVFCWFRFSFVEF
jgi:hypothetical protein